MVFTPSESLPKLPRGKLPRRPVPPPLPAQPDTFNPDPPDSITIAEFVNNEKYGRYPVAKARNPFTCGITGKTYTMTEVLQREDFMARAIGKRLGYDICDGTEWDRVVGLFSLNTVRSL